MSLATNFRPATLDQVIGQDITVSILLKQIQLQQISNAYIFSGPSGVGKTTIARAFSVGLNGSLDGTIEVDAASNNGVDNVRTLVEEAQQRSLTAQYKIIIMDEAHMLTTAAWNALLKCIEQPPIYTVFIFCTTDPQKIPATIANRCMQFRLNKITSNDIKNRLTYICQQQQYTDYNDTVDFISKHCNGQLRDAIVMLEKASSMSRNLQLDKIIGCFGIVPYDTLFKLINAIIDQDAALALSIIDAQYDNGIDLQVFIDTLISFMLDILKFILLNDISIISIPAYMQKDIQLATNFNNAKDYYSYYLDKLLELKNIIKTDTNIKNTVEITLLQMCKLK